MRKNLRFVLWQSYFRVNPQGLVVLNDAVVEFSKDEIRHTSRKIEYWEEGKKHSSILLNNNFDLDPEEIIEIYKRRWQIELLFKQLKQNFPLKYFFGESVNAIKTQIWVTLIANLLLTVIQKRVKRDWSFSNLVTMVRQTLMYYINIYSFCENPEKAWMEIIALNNYRHLNLHCSTSRGLLFYFVDQTMLQIDDNRVKGTIEMFTGQQ